MPEKLQIAGVKTLAFRMVTVVAIMRISAKFLKFILSTLTMLRLLVDPRLQSLVGHLAAGGMVIHCVLMASKCEH